MRPARRDDDDAWCRVCVARLLLGHAANRGLIAAIGRFLVAIIQGSKRLSRVFLITVFFGALLLAHTQGVSIDALNCTAVVLFNLYPGYL